MAEGALEGLRVLDLSRGIAGPYAAKLLADCGADVVKVERPGDGDLTRHTGPFPGDTPHAEKSGLFLHLNTNKRGITVDLKRPAGADLVRRLAADSDVVIESFRPGTLDRLGLSYDQLSRDNPTLVLTSLSNFGQNGPYRDWEASDLILWALSSRMSMFGAVDKAPLKYAGSVGQYFAANHAALATMGAVMGAALTGQGQWLDCSLHEALTSGVDSRLVFYEYTKDVPHRKDAMNSSFLPAADGELQMSLQQVTTSNRAWQRFTEMIGRPDLQNEPGFATPALRAPQLAKFQQMLLEWLAGRGKREASEAAQAIGMTASPVLSVDEVMADPHHNARGFFVDVTHPTAGTLRYPGAPFIMGESPWAIRRPAPLLGQHTAEVFQERLGLTPAEIAGLQAEGVI
ncbi:MAG: CoA transferase [Chloroflexi bacterium]|nr:CoA transferase [Chloroflexota bacterium]